MSAQVKLANIMSRLANGNKCAYVCVCVHAHACVCVCMLSCFSGVQLCVTPWTVACQAPLSMGFSRHEYWSGLPWPPLGHLPDPGMEPTSATSAFAGGIFTTSATWKPMETNSSVQLMRQRMGVGRVCIWPCHR